MSQPTTQNATPELNDPVAPHRLVDSGGVPASLAAAASDGTFLWAASSCVCLLVGGLGPQAHLAMFDIGALVPGTTLTAAYVVSGKIYVLAALVAAAGLALHRTRPNRPTSPLRVVFCAAIAGSTCAAFSFVQISLASQADGLSAGWGLYVAFLASLSLCIACVVLRGHAPRRPRSSERNWK